MSQNILAKKRWNVWNEENRARVRRDEKEHAEKEAAKARKLAAVEAEARLEALRARAVPSLRRGGAPDAAPPALADAGADGAVVESGGAPVALAAAGGGGALGLPDADWRESLAKRAFAVSGGGNAVEDEGGNPEYAKEKKEEELKALKKRGYDPWKLGDGAAETQEHKPWYHYSSPVGAPARNRWGKPVVGDEAQRQASREERRKHVRDPALDIVKALSKKTGHAPSSVCVPPPASSLESTIAAIKQRMRSSGDADGGAAAGAPTTAAPSSSSSSSSDSSSETSSASDHRKHKRRRRSHGDRRRRSSSGKRHSSARRKSRGKREKKEKKEKREKREKARREKEAKRIAREAAKKRQLEQLRAERVARERAEARREGQLFVHDAESKPAEEAARTVPVYSSQFNPTLARQNRR